MSDYCTDFDWAGIAHASRADGCEFTLGLCRRCRRNVVHMFSNAAGGEGAYVVTEPDVAATIKALHGKELKEFMRQWYLIQQASANGSSRRDRNLLR